MSWEWPDFIRTTLWLIHLNSVRVEGVAYHRVDKTFWWRMNEYTGDGQRYCRTSATLKCMQLLLLPAFNCHPSHPLPSTNHWRVQPLGHCLLIISLVPPFLVASLFLPRQSTWHLDLITSSPQMILSSLHGSHPLHSHTMTLSGPKPIVSPYLNFKYPALCSTPPVFASISLSSPKNFSAPQTPNPLTLTTDMLPSSNLTPLRLHDPLL